ncbi:hypothetical protein E1A91_A04G008700v1 [Gossypium mustelinum]|uniref:Leucine-rich repeat-containing N-terminal plant-type domain-containing protein n=1 Tax=Gossypium mustelinum TaxID=34275 RepID=A0A5D2ZM81_GOSMU|nr:hypothetical protein E1A91_A04G008700v1 [Gossypium mustelinum]
MASLLFLCLFLFFPHLYASSSGSHSCSSLIQFKNSFSITKTPLAAWYCDEIAGLKSYPKTNSWKEGTDCCSWDGVTCDHLNAHVIALDLSCSWLYGNFPSNTTLFLLPHLQKLNLAHNDFNYSKIPSEFGRFTSLFFLNLSRTRSLGNLFQLTHLDFSMNQLSGQIPRSFGNLLQLTHLDLSWNQLSGQIPRSLGNLLQLTHLDLSGNQLSGQIPLSILNLTQLEYLRITQNLLEGSIPDEVTAFPNLISLMLIDNLLNGTLPSWLYTAPSLKEIYLSENQFSGHIKEFQSKSLELIALGNNKLQGPLPSSIFQLLNLTQLSLSSNNLSGVIEFSMFSNLPNLKHLDLSYISLSLTSNTTSSVNHILPNLTDLLLSSCNLSEFPRFLKGLKSLVRLDISCNKIEGKIPQWMQKVDSLWYLNVSHNSLTEVGHFPWKNIEVLDLSSNLIRGNLPIPASTIKVFLISNNSFNGEVSSLICNASSLRIVDLSHNNLSGTIPQCFGNLSKTLEFLNLKKNKFYGTIPPTFAKGCQLSNFNLNGNLLEGPLTLSILNCRGLEVLDLGNNKINNTFPHWLGSLPQLQILVLKSNQMHGSLCVNSSRSSPFFPKIQIFDLSSNYFSGPLPARYIDSFKAIINLTKDASTMTYMGVQDANASIGIYSYSVGIVVKGQDITLNKIFVMWAIIDLSNNKFDGEIPKVIGKLRSLKGLNLSHNNLSGYIPSSIGSLTSLEWLDLSSNKLVGRIPRELLNLTALSTLNLSMNELIGCIPHGKQFNTFGNTSYEGNKGLHGFPLSSDCNNNELPPPSNLLEEGGSKSKIGFGWKVVLLGYGCGVVLGLGVGYVVFQTGKPKWIRRRRKPMTGDRNNGRRRI